MTPAPSAAPAPAVRRPIRSVDLQYRRRDYRVTLPDGSRPLCLRCAIRAGLLLETPESIERREQEARDIAAEIERHQAEQAWREFGGE